jgi:acylphosphatase
MQTISIIVTGKVQGVYFRQHTKEKALMLGLTGEVKNLPDGSVCITATGLKPQIDELISWCRTGPSRAIVTNIEVKELDLLLFDDFKIVRS